MSKYDARVGLQNVWYAIDNYIMLSYQNSQYSGNSVTRNAQLMKKKKKS